MAQPYSDCGKRIFPTVHVQVGGKFVSFDVEIFCHLFNVKLIFLWVIIEGPIEKRDARSISRLVLLKVYNRGLTRFRVDEWI